MPVPRTTREELKQQLDSGDPATVPVLLDVRLKYPYEHSTVRLPGAVRMHPDEIDPARLPRDRAIVVYDSDPDEIVSAPVAADLIARGFRAMALKGGIADWMGASLPTEPKEAPRQAPPGAGTLKG
jgi:rhodanese-related sulfurtransferase